MNCSYMFAKRISNTDRKAGGKDSHLKQLREIFELCTKHVTCFINNEYKFENINSLAHFCQAEENFEIFGSCAIFVNLCHAFIGDGVRIFV